MMQRCDIQLIFFMPLLPHLLHQPINASWSFVPLQIRMPGCVFLFLSLLLTLYKPTASITDAHNHSADSTWIKIGYRCTASSVHDMSIVGDEEQNDEKNHENTFTVEISSPEDDHVLIF